VPGEGKSAGQYLRPLRDLAVYALVGATAVWLLVAIIRLIPDGPDQFAGRTEDSFYGFVNLQTIFFPIAAVLLAVSIQPRHPKAQLIVTVALIEYAVAAFFGLFFGVLIGLINHAANNSVRLAFEELLVRVAWLAVFAVAAYGLYQIWQHMFRTPRAPKPVAQQGMYGQPQYGAPGGYPGQPGYGGPPPGNVPPGAGYPPPGYPPAPSGPPPGNYGQPPQPPAWNQPVSSAPASAPPGGAFSEPTQVVPQQPPQHQQPETYGQHQQQPPTYGQHQQPETYGNHEQTDRTQKIDENRPGYGPADQDPPRS
jgi:hypothetical protein